MLHATQMQHMLYGWLCLAFNGPLLARPVQLEIKRPNQPIGMSWRWRERTWASVYSVVRPYWADVEHICIFVVGRPSVISDTVFFFSLQNRSNWCYSCRKSELGSIIFKFYPCQIFIRPQTKYTLHTSIMLHESSISKDVILYSPKIYSKCTKILE